MIASKEFIFYAKYPQEIDAFLDDSEDFDPFDGLSEELSEFYSNIVDIVAEKSAETCWQILKQSIKKIKERTDCRIVQSTRQHGWEIQCRLYRKNGPFPETAPAWLGIEIDTNKKSDKLRAACWIWMKNNKNSIDNLQEKLISIFKEKAIRVTQEEKGVTVYLLEHDIQIIDDTIDANDLIERLSDPFTKITSKQMHNIFEL